MLIDPWNTMRCLTAECLTAECLTAEYRRFRKRPALSTSLLGLVLLCVGTLCSSAIAQPGVPTSTNDNRGRKLAPDALHVIPPAVEYGETFQGPIDLPEVLENPDLQWEPNYVAESETLVSKGQNIVFRGDVYCLEFAFKPVRMIEVDVPTAEGVERKNVWYLLYRVRYLGGDFRPKVEQDPFDNEVYAIPQSVSAEWVRFFPQFRLDAKKVDKQYKDQIITAAKRPIAIKERVGRPIYDSLELQKLKIELSTEADDNPVWGVATWVDVDPRTDFFSVEVGGLTNAQRIEQDGTEFSFPQKTLVLHFARPGDTIDELSDQIRFGIPALSEPDRQQYVLDQFGMEERLDHTWIYR